MMSEKKFSLAAQIENENGEAEVLETLRWFYSMVAFIFEDAVLSLTKLEQKELSIKGLTQLFLFDRLKNLESFKNYGAIEYTGDISDEFKGFIFTSNGRQPRNVLPEDTKQILTVNVQ